MHPYTTKIKEYFTKNPPEYVYDVDSLWEMLYIFYTECNPIQPQEHRHLNDTLVPYFRPLTLKEKDTVFMLVGDLLVQHERTAFLEGAKFGTRLAIELLEE